MEALLKSFLNKYRSQIGIFLVAAVLVGGGVLTLITGRSEPHEIEKISDTTPSNEDPDEATVSGALVPKIKIDVAGAVANPGVYELSEDDRVEEALGAAGGLAEGADREWVAKNLNLAAKLSDGDKLYIPKVGETTSAPSSINTPAPAVGIPSGGESLNCSRVNINTASAATLADCLSGIGTTKAQSIIEYREAHGGFKSIEEIKNVKGIAEGTFAKIKDQITVN